jgi:hypothetical protein
MTQISLESWTWIYIAMTRIELNRLPIHKSNIAKYMGEYND